MNETDILRNINGDISSAPATRIIYLEGVSDPPMFFALLGRSPTVVTADLYRHQNTAVKGLSKGGSGKAAVERYIQVAQNNKLGGRVFGVVDGDGELLTTLIPKFDHPFPGPLYTWKAYCIESLFPQCPWNLAWGAAPDWRVELERYTPYIGLCRTHLRLAKAQGELRLSKRTTPKHPDPLLTVAGEKARLAADKGKITGFDAEAVFDTEVNDFAIALGNSVVEAMALLDGKWLLADYLVRNHGGGDYNIWMGRWIAHLTASGGLTEVKDLWQRITGSPP